MGDIEQKIQTMIANYIGYNVYVGVYWYSFINSPAKTNQLNTLTQYIIASDKVVKDYYTTKLLNDKGQLVVFNKNIFIPITEKMLNEFYANNPQFPKLSTPFNLEEAKKQEIKVFANYLKSVTKDEIDIYLYRVDSTQNRLNTLILHENKDIYKKRIYGFHLTEEDIEEVNLYIAKNNQKIAQIERKECLTPELGIRYTITLTQADIIKEF